MVKPKLVNTQRSKFFLLNNRLSNDIFKTRTFSSHIIEIQTKLSERALELLALSEDEPGFILDIGCGSGLSGEVLSDNGHYWVGIDISNSMLGELF